MNDIFNGCVSLESLPDLSKWDTSKVKNMSNMFYGCKSLKSLPEITEWDISNVDNMNNIFYDCNSLEYFPYNKILNTSKVNNIIPLFLGCNSLKKLSKFYIEDILYNTIFLELAYKYNKEDKVKIFGKKFIEKNKLKGGIIYNNNRELLLQNYPENSHELQLREIFEVNRELQIQEYFEDINKNNKGEIKLFLYLDKNIEDISYMFNECDSLLSVKFAQLIVNNFTPSESNDTINSFYDCCKQHIEKVSNISNQDIKNVNSAYKNWKIKTMRSSFVDVNR